MKTQLLPLVVVCCFAAFQAGCTFPSSRRTVSASQANVLQRSDLGVVTSVREVNIEGQKGQLGMYGGGLLGGAAASGGKGVTGAVTRAGGAVVGAVTGQAVEEVATRKRAQEITIRLDDGGIVTIVQEASSGLFMDGDRVKVVNGGGQARVMMATQ